MGAIGLVGYSLASLAFLVFTLLLVAARNNTLQGRIVLVASIFTVVSSLFAALQIKYHFTLQLVFLVEAIKTGAWLLLIYSAREKVSKLRALIRNKSLQKYFIAWLFMVVGSWVASTQLDVNYKYLFLLFIVLNLWLLVLLEQLFRNAGSQLRWALWPLVIALGAISVFDFVLFAQAVMVAQLDFNFWYSRGFVVMVTVPLLLISTRRMKDWSVNVFISRNVVFYSSMLLISGLYLLIMAFAGYVINYFGGQWGSLVSVAFWALGGSVLVVLLITESLRRKVKVFIAKHFFANKYDYRIEWLKLIEQLEQEHEGGYCHTATEIIKSSLAIEKGAIATRIAKGHYKVVYNDGLDIADSLRKQFQQISSFNQSNQWIIDVSEYKRQPALYQGLELNVAQWQATGVRLIVPIYVNKNLYGFFLLSSPESTSLLNWEDRDLLFAIAKQLGNYLSLNEANEKLAEAKQFDAFNRMSAFLVHDLKNVQAQLTLINANAKKHRDNPEFVDDVFETIESATSRLDKVLTQLRNKQVAQKTNKQINLRKLLEKVIAQRNVISPLVSLDLVGEIEITIDAETLFSVLNHLIQNGQEATAKDGWVKVKVEAIDDYVHLAIIDNGAGMSAQFIATRLFKPFDTTKGNAGMGIGVYEAKQFIEGAGGTLQVASFVGKGTTFNLTLPLHQYD